MQRLVRSLVALVGVAMSVALLPLPAAASSVDLPIRNVMTFDTAFANVSPFIGTAGAIRGVTAAPLPWAIKAVFGNLESNGQLIVAVHGLVLANDPAVPANLRGTNPVPDFAAIVSCVTSSNGAVATVNTTSADFPATADGNALIHQRLTLPQPCAAPDVFITSPGGAVWFAATGSASGQPNRDILHFDSAFANVSPFIGAAGTITGVTAAPLPWAVKAIHGDFDSNGDLNIAVIGLVLANDPAVPANLRGTNPVPDFAAVVTCRTNSNGAVAVTRTTSADFPASPEGNALIHAKLTLTQPCVTPYVFVTSPGGAVWFAVDGR